MLENLAGPGETFSQDGLFLGIVFLFVLRLFSKKFFEFLMDRKRQFINIDWLFIYRTLDLQNVVSLHV